MNHIKALTYRPKIEAVFNGTCNQTIRIIPKDKDHPEVAGVPKIKVGDSILFHTWAGRPYFSKWDRRLDVKVVQAIPIFNWGGCWHHWPPSCEPITDSQMDTVAKFDGIEPATGVALEQLLMKLNGLKSLHDTDWLIIRFERVASSRTNDVKSESVKGDG